MITEVYENTLFEGLEGYSSSPRTSHIRHFEVNNRQSVKNSTVNLANLSKTDVLHQKEGWKIMKMFDPSYLPTDIEWEYSPDYYFKAKIVDFQMARRELSGGYDCYYLNIIYLVDVPSIGVKLFRQDNISANFTTGSNLTHYLFNMGFDLYNMDYFNPQDLIGLDVVVNIGRNDSNYLVVNYAEKLKI